MADLQAAVELDPDDVGGKKALRKAQRRLDRHKVSIGVQRVGASSFSSAQQNMLAAQRSTTVHVITGTVENRVLVAPAQTYAPPVEALLRWVPRATYVLSELSSRLCIGSHMQDGQSRSKRSSQQAARR